MLRLSLVLTLVLAGLASAFHPNDDCGSALTISIPSSGSFNTTGAATNPEVCAAATPQNGIWFLVVGNGTLLRFSTCGLTGSGDMSIQVFTGLCGSLICVGGNDETFCSVDAAAADVTWCAENGITYYVHVGGETGFVSGPYSLTSLGPCNYLGGNCVPQPITAPITVTGTTVNHDDCCFSDGADVHYAVTLPYTSSWKFVVCGHSGPWNTLHVSTSFCGEELCSVSEDSPFQTPAYGCGPFYGLCPCAVHVAGTYHITIDSGTDDGQGGPFKLVVVDCNAIGVNPNVILNADVSGYSCEALEADQPLTVIVQGDNLDPNEPPILVLTAGCSGICGGDDVPATWHFDPASWILEDGMPGIPGFEDPFWQNTIVGLSNGSVCVALEGFLGVELTSFSALAGDHSVILQWQTASESNLSDFEVERDGVMLASIPASNSATGSSYMYVDRAAQNGRTHTYTLYAEELNGDRVRLATQSATPLATPEIVGGFALAQNYPNPFNPETTIEYSLNEAGTVKLSVFDLNGREVMTLVNGNRNDGMHSVKVDASSLASGIYFYQLEHNGLKLSKKMVLMK